MKIDLESVKNFVPLESVVSGIAPNEALDSNEPYSYVEWLERTQISVNEGLDMTAHYNTYLTKWNELTGGKYEDIETLIVNRYKSLLSDISLNYSTDEEKRFISNVDLNNIRQLEAVIPFYVSKIKQVSIYICQQRDLLKHKRMSYQVAGSNQGLIRDVSTTILNELNNPEYRVTGNKQPGDKQFTVSLHELYDMSKKYFREGDVKFDNIVFGSASEIVRDVLLKCNTTLSLTNDLNLVLNLPVVNTSDDQLISTLPHDEFTGYNKIKQELNQLLVGDYVDKSIGTDMYTLSGGVLSILTKPTAPWRNILNRGEFRINDRHHTDNLIRVDQLGGYFTPKYTKLLTYYSESPKPVVTDTSVTVDKLSDVTRYGSSVLNDTVNAPIDHVEDITWLKVDSGNDFAFGDMIQTSRMPKFNGYISIDEITGYPRSGVSRSTDRFDFFTGTKSDQWANPDVHELEAINIYPLDERQETLLTGHQDLYNLRSDVYGNEFALYKYIKPVKLPGSRPDNYQDEAGDVAIGCDVIDGGDSLLPTLRLYDDGVEFDIYDGGRAPNNDPKIEQSFIGIPFPDIRRPAEIDSDGNIVLEDWNTHYYGYDPSKENKNIIDIYPVTFHGFEYVVYDRQAYGGLFTDYTCGLEDPQRECEILDNYAYGVYTEKKDTQGNYKSLEIPSDQDDYQDAFEFYINPGHEEFDPDLGFSNFGFPISGSDVQIIQVNKDGDKFDLDFCTDQPDDYEYVIDNYPLFMETLTIAETKFAEDPDIKTPDLTLYQARMQTGGGVFRSYNGAKITNLYEAISPVIENFVFNENTDYGEFRHQIQSNQIRTIDVIYDVLIIETTNYLFMTKISFDTENSVFQPTNHVNIFIKTVNRESPAEQCMQWFFNDYTGELLAGFTSLSGTDYNYTVYPRLLRIDLNTLHYEQAHPNKDYDDQHVGNFTLTGDLSDSLIESVDRPIITYDNETKTYNVSYTCMLSSGDTTTYGVFSSDYIQGQYNMKLKECRMYHGESITRYVSQGPEWNPDQLSKSIRLDPSKELIPDDDNPHVVVTKSLSSMLGYTLSADSFTLDIDTGTAPVSATKVSQILFDPGDGAETIVINRDMNAGIEFLTFDISKLPDQSDVGDPRKYPLSYTYQFNSPVHETLTASLSVVYCDFKTLNYRYTIEKSPQSVASGFQGLKLVDSKIYSEKQDKKQLLVLETQRPAYITNVIIDR